MKLFIVLQAILAMVIPLQTTSDLKLPIHMKVDRSHLPSIHTLFSDPEIDLLKMVIPAGHDHAREVDELRKVFDKSTSAISLLRDLGGDLQRIDWRVIMAAERVVEGKGMGSGGLRRSEGLKSLITKPAVEDKAGLPMWEGVSPAASKRVNTGVREIISVDGKTKSGLESELGAEKWELL